MPQPTIHPKLLHPANDFIAEQLPTWLRVPDQNHWRCCGPA